MISETQFVVINQAATTTVVAAVAGCKIRVTSLFLVNTAAQSLTFKSGAGGTPISGAMALPATGVLVLPFNSNGWCETAAGALLELAQSGATQVSGTLAYVLVS